MLGQAYQLSEDGKYAEALKYFEDILQIEHDNINTIVDYGVTLQNLELYHRALEMYDIALSLDPKNTNALINKGTVLHELKKYTDAITCYDTVLNTKENNPIVLVYKGLSIAETGSINLATKYFKKALSIDAECKLAEISMNRARYILNYND